jgi:hypothetical protein
MQSLTRRRTLSVIEKCLLRKVISMITIWIHVISFLVLNTITPPPPPPSLYYALYVLLQCISHQEGASDTVTRQLTLMCLIHCREIIHLP